MLAFSLPSVTPSLEGLLPHLDRSSFPSENQAGAQNQQSRRNQKNAYPQTAHQLLLAEENLIEHRKIAIAKFGYSWLRPAGCAKTMLGRDEEMAEREEAERQLREHEAQERLAGEMEEQERQRLMEEQRRREEAGEVVEDEGGEVDLDADVPDAEEEEEEDEWEEEDDEDELSGDEIDLDADVPDADGSAASENEQNTWGYDTTRDLSSAGSEADGQFDVRPNNPQRILGRPSRAAPNANINVPPRTRVAFQSQQDSEEVASAMLEEDELEASIQDDHDLDESIPDLDAQRDLEDSMPVPSSEPGWEHTDTELEESEMDISILPPGIAGTTHQRLAGPTVTRLANPPSSGMGIRSPPRRPRPQQAGRPSGVASSSAQRQQSPGLRRTSGNQRQPSQPGQIDLRAPASSRPLHASFTPDQYGSELNTSALISTGESREFDSSFLGQNQNAYLMNQNAVSDGSRGWLDASSARRNLFGTGGGNGGTSGLFTPEQPGMSGSRQASVESSGLPQDTTRNGRVMRSRHAR